MDSEETPLKQIRTFQGDVAEALRRQQESLVTIQRAEFLRRNTTEPSANLPPENTKRRTELFLLTLGSIVLLTLAISGIWLAYNEFVRRSTTPIIIAPANRFIASDTLIDLGAVATSRDALISTFVNSAGNVPYGELKQIDSAFSTSEFMKLLESRAPSSLIRAFNPLFMFGSFGASTAVGGTSTFLIIKLDSFENAYAGMLEWEKNLGQDLGPLFATTNLIKSAPSESVFTDITDRNKDIRMLAIGGQSALLYTFFDNNMLIITDNIETLRILIDRLTREKLSR